MTETANSTAVAKRRYSDEELRNLTNWDQVVALSGKPILPIAETSLSTGFDVIKDKATLVGVPFLILDFGFSMGDQGEFVSMQIITRDNRKLIVNDGGTGIHDQLRKLEWDGSVIGVARGLRKSDYERRDDDGAVILNAKSGLPERATTYYLDTSSTTA